jgi:8-oxo-dGTP pyrophosphatase MutT (NUDIX family)
MRKAVDYIAVGVVFCCHDGQGNILLGKRSTNARDEWGRWDIGGGGLHVGESLLAAVEREVVEEYAATIHDIVPLGYREVHRENDSLEKTHWISFDFAVRVDPQSVKNLEPEKCVEIGWFRLDSLPAPLHSQWPVFIKKYRQILTDILE